MEKIKRSFIKTFLPILISVIVLSMISIIFSILGGFGTLLGLILTSPFYIGFYSFLFKRMEDETPEFSVIFKFYRSGRSWWKSFWMYCLGGLILGTAFVVILLICVFSGMYTNIDYMVSRIFIVFLLSIGIDLFLFMPYMYAKAPYIGIGDALSGSFKLGLKYLFVLLAIDIVIGAVRIGFSIYDISAASVDDFMEYAQRVGMTRQYSPFDSFLSIFVDLITTSLSMWANFTAVYIIIEREKIFDGNYDYTAENDTEEEESFIEPYDFFIEADERFNNEKVIETEDIRGVDIIALFDGMELIDDIKVNYIIRRKLKKMFGELSFEIGEYNTYNGGRSIENSFTEEIDEREFEVSVEITKNSDYEQFKLILRVNVLKED